jgi:hypothetical protein
MLKRTMPSLAARLAPCGMLLFWLAAMGCNSSVHAVDETPVDLSPGDQAKPCGLTGQCPPKSCAAMGLQPTTISGVVNIPAGNLPLYGATVYIPSGAIPPIPGGVSCDRCDNLSAENPLVVATTDVSGHFKLVDVPPGKNIPLVVRLGKWRRKVTIPQVQACADNPVDAAYTRLPRNQLEGSIPKIAIVTGGYDAVECLFRKIGISDTEFTTDSGNGRINLFAGEGGTAAFKPGYNLGASFTRASDTPGMTDGWWSKLDNLMRYDIIVLSCEGTPYQTEKSATALAAMESYINYGGKVFASHWHNVWMSAGSPAMRSIATFGFPPGIVYPSATVDINLQTPAGLAFDKGNALADWMVAAGGSPSPPGRGHFLVSAARGTVNSLNTALAQRYVTMVEPMQGRTIEQYFSFFAPIGAAAKDQCGRMVFTDMHVSGNDANMPDPNLDLSRPTLPFPTGCVTSDLSAQEKALLFLLFDLSGCVQPVIG